MLVDISHEEDRLTINLDMTFPRMPCEALTLDVQDVMNMQITDIRGDLDMKWLRSDGSVIGSFPLIEMFKRQTGQEFIERIAK